MPACTSAVHTSHRASSCAAQCLVQRMFRSVQSLVISREEAARLATGHPGPCSGGWCFQTANYLDPHASAGAYNIPAHRLQRDILGVLLLDLGNLIYMLCRDGCHRLVPWPLTAALKARCLLQKVCGWRCLCHLRDKLDHFSLSSFRPRSQGRNQRLGIH